MNFAFLIGRMSVPCTFACVIACAGVAASGSGCSTSPTTSPATSPTTTSTTSPATEAGGVSSCTSPGSAAMGPPTDRCTAGDGGLIVQAVSAAACTETGDAGTDEDSCAYGDTLFGQSGVDDDCKYTLSWTSTPICEGGPGVQFTAVAQYNGTSEPLTGAGTRIEYYIPLPASDGGPPACDSLSSHLGPTQDPGGGFYQMTEISPGTYQGQIVFDQAGTWTMRFHFNENCFDEVEASPHGHIAFHIDVNAM